MIVDWVPAHFPKDAFALARFDGTALYEHADPRQGEHPDWGTLVFNFGRHEVSNFLLANALFWMEEFHIDGLRVDAVASMLYLDYSRKEGEWLPNQFGGRENLEAVDFLRRMNELVYGNHPGAITMAEESTAWPAVSRPDLPGRARLRLQVEHGLDARHPRVLLEAARSTARYHHHHLTFGLLYAFTENFVLPLSHDEVVHGKGSLLDKMPGEGAEKFAHLRALYAWMWAHPGKQLLFMGGEFAQGREWSHEGSIEWDLLQWPEHAGVHHLVRRLNAVYGAEPALFERDFDPSGLPVDRRQRRRPERDLLRPLLGRRVADAGVRGQPVGVRPPRLPHRRAPGRAGGAPPSTPSPPSSPAGDRTTATTSAPTASPGTASTSPSPSTCPR